jgi:hypothetical protein
MEEDKEKLKIDALLREYIEIRHESRTYEVLQIVCISLSALTFVVMLIVAVSSNEYILLFISPLVSIFFILLAIGMQVYITNLGLRASQIEDQLKNILGEPVIQWESTIENPLYLVRRDLIPRVTNNDHHRHLKRHGLNNIIAVCLWV